MSNLIVSTMGNILANTLADKNRGLSPVYGNLLVSYCQTLLAQNHRRHFSKHIGRQKPGKGRVYVLHYDRQIGISIGRTK
jgi:hypothetical protein